MNDDADAERGRPVETGPDGTSLTVREGHGGWTYHHTDVARPFLDPVRTPSGLPVSRDAPDDHPWHHGLWFTIKFVNGDNFWEEWEDFGLLRHRGAPSVETDAEGGVRLAGTIDWIAPDETTVAVVETRTLTHVPLDGEAYAIDLDTTLVAPIDTTYDRTPFTTWGGYGGLSLRGPGDWADTRLLLGDGTDHQRVLGESAPWCDLSSDDRGVTLLDHPGNPRFPCPWYGSTRAGTYGDEGWSNFLNAAFLWHEPLEVEAGEPLRIRHRAVVHDGRWDRAQADAAHEAYVG